MTSYTILHNTRCSKSRKALQILKENSIALTVIEYLKAPLNKNQLTTLFLVSLNALLESAYEPMSQFTKS